ncbi:MAG: hypothetical protein HN576_11015 [Bacteriovoracaceae bacterium]|nr:hypothetical protein [Bacteriovoracaceae bacterium]
MKNLGKKATSAERGWSNVPPYGEGQITKVIRPRTMGFGIAKKGEDWFHSRYVLGYRTGTCG